MADPGSLGIAALVGAAGLAGYGATVAGPDKPGAVTEAQLEMARTSLRTLERAAEDQTRRYKALEKEVEKLRKAKGLPTLVVPPVTPVSEPVPPVTPVSEPVPPVTPVSEPVPPIATPMQPDITPVVPPVTPVSEPVPPIATPMQPDTTPVVAPTTPVSEPVPPIATPAATDNAPIFEHQKPAPPTVARPGFLEPQEKLGCGRHALNNLLGDVYFIQDDETKIEDIRQLRIPVSLQTLCRYIEEKPAIDCPSDENYSILVLEAALRLFGFEVDSQINPATANALEDREDTIGFLIHKPGHWVALKRAEGDTYIYLDSIGSVQNQGNLQDLYKTDVKPSSDNVFRIKATGITTDKKKLLEDTTSGSPSPAVAPPAVPEVLPAVPEVPPAIPPVVPEVPPAAPPGVPMFPPAPSAIPAAPPGMPMFPPAPSAIPAAPPGMPMFAPPPPVVPATGPQTAIGKNKVELRIGDLVSCDLYGNTKTGAISRFITRKVRGQKTTYVEVDFPTGKWSQPASSCVKVDNPPPQVDDLVQRLQASKGKAATFVETAKRGQLAYTQRVKDASREAQRETVPFSQNLRRMAADVPRPIRSTPPIPLIDARRRSTRRPIPPHPPRPAWMPGGTRRMRKNKLRTRRGGKQKNVRRTRRG